ncbi:MmcB family DNA repair protein [uncultured Paracoccus sp.]|uniref:MmcB family DNA repair protein n=1 Tax=uncultured Paracoccus sp. TaxID=189685 RepID=UPI00260590CD|nr:MmcB family DNA repair protein [uncultured Paracoccus sp.]
MTDTSTLMPGQRLARGVTRLLISMGHAPLAEFVPTPGLRVDVVSVSPAGEIWIVECKSCRSDFAGDRKWQGYLPFCDRFFWATDGDFPTELLPGDSGLILADPYGAELLRPAPLVRLAPARRAKLLREIARVATCRVAKLADPDAFDLAG